MSIIGDIVWADGHSWVKQEGGDDAPAWTDPSRGNPYNDLPLKRLQLFADFRTVVWNGKLLPGPEPEPVHVGALVERQIRGVLADRIAEVERAEFEARAGVNSQPLDPYDRGYCAGLADAAGLCRGNDSTT